MYDSNKMLDTKPLGHVCLIRVVWNFASFLNACVVYLSSGSLETHRHVPKTNQLRLISSFGCNTF